MTTLTLALADFAVHVRCLELDEVLAIRRALDAEGDARDLLVEALSTTLRLSLVDEQGGALLYSDDEAEAFIDRIGARDTARLLGAALSASADLAETLAFAAGARDFGRDFVLGRLA